METIKVKKTGQSQYGYYLLIDDGSEKGTFRGTTQQVSGFLSKQIPCEVEVEEVGEKNVVTRVKVVKSNFTQPSATAQPEVKQEFKPSNEYYDNRQESIVTQMCIKKGSDLLMKTDEQINFVNLLKYSELVKSVYTSMIEKKQEFPDY